MKNRKVIRLKGYDYSLAGAYFVTICTYNSFCSLGHVKEGIVILSTIGKKADKFWQEISAHHGNTQLDEFIVMPNHVHGIIMITENDAHCRGVLLNASALRGITTSNGCKNGDYERGVYLNAPTHHVRISPRKNTLSVIIRTYKATLTNWCRHNGFGHFKWQRNYYEHIIRNEKELFRIREYIQNNPVNWELDRENPSSKNFNLEHDLYWQRIYERTSTCRGVLLNTPDRGGNSTHIHSVGVY